MLLVDEIVDESSRQDPPSIVCRKTFHADEFFFDGHFPDAPIVPGVIQCECCLQAGAVLLARPKDDAVGSDEPKVGESSEGESVDEKTVAPMTPVATRIDGVKFKRMIRPGDVAEIAVELKDHVSTAYYLTGKVTVNGKLSARLDFTVTMQPSANQVETA